METKTRSVDWTKPVYRNIRGVKTLMTVLSTTARGSYPIVLQVNDASDDDLFTATPTGQAFVGSDRVYFNYPETRTYYLNVYRNGEVYGYSTAQEAKKSAASHALAVAVPWEFTPPEGD